MMDEEERGETQLQLKGSETQLEVLGGEGMELQPVNGEKEELPEPRAQRAEWREVQWRLLMRGNLTPPYGLHWLTATQLGTWSKERLETSLCSISGRVMFSTFVTPTSRPMS